jgi:hypothetical protein
MRNARIANERASESVTKVEALVGKVQAAERKIGAILTQAKATEQDLLEVEERQILRNWINILPDLSELMHPVTGARGKRRYVVNPQVQAIVPFQRIKGGQWDWTWTCDDDSLQQLTQLVEKLPFIPYARVARADCLKKSGDPTWKADAEHAKILLEKMRNLQPHPKEIDDFYSLCLSLLETQ